MSVLFAGALILLSSRWRMWWGGHCYGPRLLADAVPCLVLLTIPALDLVARAAVLRVSFVVLVAWSTFARVKRRFFRTFRALGPCPTSLSMSVQTQDQQA